MPVSRPIPVRLPGHGVTFAESVHAPGFRMAERSDRFHKLIYVLHGKVAFSTAARRAPWLAPASSVICVHAQVRHRIEDAAPPTLLLVCFADEFLHRIPGLAAAWAKVAGGGSACLRPSRPWTQRFERVWRVGVVEQTGLQIGHEAAIGSAAADILVSLARLPATPIADEARRRVEAVAREMAGTFFEPWSLERACTRAGMSRRHFSKLFRAVTGHSFLEELTSLRMRHAAVLLRAGTHSVLGAAFSSGYGDLSHFYRLFRAYHGKPPGAWAGAKQPAPTESV